MAPSIRLRFVLVLVLVPVLMPSDVPTFLTLSYYSILKSEAGLEREPLPKYDTRYLLRTT